MIPAHLFDALALAGSLAAVLLLLAAVPGAVRLRARLGHRDARLTNPGAAILTLTVLGFSGAYAIAIATRLPIFDRYALPVIPLIGILFLGAVRSPIDPSSAPATGSFAITRSQVATTALASIVMAVVGLVISSDSASFDATRWRMDVAVSRLGYSPLAINGGFEWISYHRRVGPPTHTPDAAERLRLKRRYFRGLCVDVIVNPTPIVARRAIARETMHAPGRRSVLFVAVLNERRCAGSSPSVTPGPAK